MIREDCDRLLKTVTDILDLTRLESKSLKLNKSKLPFSRLVRHCFDQFRFQCEKKGQEMCLAVDQACGFVCCDPLKMDTDGDGFDDGLEVEVGMDPLVAGDPCPSWLCGGGQRGWRLKLPLL